MTKKISLRSSILRLVLGVLAFSSVATMLNVWLTTTKTAQNQIAETLNVGESVLKQVFQNREAQLFNSAQVLTDDFGFKQAVATGDEATIDSVLSNHGARIDADLMALLNLNGNLRSSTKNISESAQLNLLSNAQLDDILRTGGSSFWTVLEGQLYQAILLTVDAPTPIAIALVGFKVDQALLQNFDDITQLHTTIELPISNNQTYTISTLPDDHIEKSLNKMGSGFAWLMIKSTKNSFVSRQFNPNNDTANAISIVLSANVEKSFSTFYQLQKTIIIIAIASLVLAGIFSVLLSQRLTRPLSQLVGLTQKLANGAYEELHSDELAVEEVSQLSLSFKAMQKNIQVREEEIRFQAQHDAVTQLYNRSHIGHLLTDKLESREAFEVVGINIQGFKLLNDTFGHQNVDAYLTKFAKRLFQLGGVSARISSSEFIWLPESPKSQADLHVIHQNLEKSIALSNLEISSKILIATLRCPHDASDSISIFKRLNIAFDEASKTEKKALQFNPEYEAKYIRRLSIIRHLKLALTDLESELSMVYQPKLHLASRKVDKLEALIRWNSEELGFVPPDEFIEIAEQANLIFELTRWVIQRVILDVKSMHDKGIKVCVAINLSAKDIMMPELLPWILNALEQHSLPVNALSFELTESDLVTDASTAAAHLSAFREAGFSLAIDDFGTGYSSLAYLQQLPVSDIKIDKSFVLNLASSDGDKKIVKNILALAKSFDLKVIAEGVEDKTSLELLSDYGCDWAQGYHICRPAPLSQTIEWLAVSDKKESLA